MNKYKDFISASDNFLKYIDKTENYKRFCEEKISECDQQRSDLDHQLELCNLNAVQLTQNNKLRQRVLQERRQYKNDLEIVSLIISKLANIQTIHNNIKATVTSVKEVESKINNRVYSPRTNITGSEKINTKRKEIQDIEKLRKVDKAHIIRKIG